MRRMPIVEALQEAIWNRFECQHPGGPSPCLQSADDFESADGFDETGCPGRTSLPARLFIYAALQKRSQNGSTR